MSVDVRIEQLPHAKGLPLPAYATEGSAGVDLCAAIAEDQEMRLRAGERTLVPTGLKIAVPPDFEAQIRPRSGLALKHGIILPNSPGTIDSDYRGELQIIVANIGHDTFTILRGMRIAQLILARVERVVWRLETVGSEETERSGSGFGSTGLKTYTDTGGNGDNN